MLARAAASSAALRAAPASNRAAAGQVRYATNLKAVKKRMTSTINFAKIFKSMKMVAASKVKKLEAPMLVSRPFAEAARDVYTAVGREVAAEGEGDAASAAAAPKKHLVVAFSSDRGLCGGVNSAVTKAVKARMADLEGQDVMINLVGDKGRPQLLRFFGDQFKTQVTEAGSGGGVTFGEACAIADEALRIPHDRTHIVHNVYKSVISYDTVVKEVDDAIVTADTRLDPEKFEADAEMESEMLQNLGEFSLACTIFNASLENATAEMAQRMTAMDNASRNADEMIDRLNTIYNRGRQAAITTELIEIISGAESLKG